VALEVREVLDAVGLEAWGKTSGSKGMQLYVPLNSPCHHDQAKSFAQAVAQLLERQAPKRVTSEMTKALRTNKVFIDWSQNSRHKTTICAYSLRARPAPTVSTPVSWEEVEAGARGDEPLVFEAPDVLARVEQFGDLFAPTADVVQSLPG
jgi:bifunctional non-homologous end joining protein LigD